MSAVVQTLEREIQVLSVRPTANVLQIAKKKLGKSGETVAMESKASVWP